MLIEIGAYNASDLPDALDAFGIDWRIAADVFSKKKLKEIANIGSTVNFDIGKKVMSDTFRKVYFPLKEESSALIAEIKAKAEELEQLFSNVKSREMFIAQTNLEQSIMWATKAVVLDYEKTTGDFGAL